MSSRKPFQTLKRIVAQAREDDATDLAAALTYYGVLALFPALIVIVAIVGLLGHSVTQPLLNSLSVAPTPVKDILHDAIKAVQGRQGVATLSSLLALAVALWSTSTYVSVFTRAYNRIHRLAPKTSFFKTRGQQILIAGAVLLLLSLIIFLVILTGPLAKHVADLAGLGNAARFAFALAKWPFLFVLISSFISLIYWASAGPQRGSFRLVSSGGVFASLVWVISSALFSIYIANIGEYNRTYGALASIIIFLIWLWISNLALLLGAELNATKERQDVVG